MLNFSKTLIQDAEITFLWYEKFPTHPDDVGRSQREILAFREQELRDAHKDSNPPALRKVILNYIEEEKAWGGFRDADENFNFKEINLVFQVRPDYSLIEVIKRVLSVLWWDFCLSPFSRSRLSGAILSR